MTIQKCAAKRQVGAEKKFYNSFEYPFSLVDKFSLAPSISRKLFESMIFFSHLKRVKFNQVVDDARV